MKKNDIWRPEYHFTAPTGWVNDPNGLIYYKEEYHLFYQHNPHGCDWASMHWGHAKSRDLLHWQHLPLALKPDKEYDDHPEGGVFSGSAIVKDGRLYLFYTGSVPGRENPQTQNMATSDDGVHFTKYEGNPVIPQCPLEHAAEHFRDPKVFEHAGAYYMVVGCCQGEIEGNGDGKVLLFTSPDLLRWAFKSVLFSSDGAYGTMLECPDFFPLDGKWVLTFSPMYMPGLRKAVYLVGEMDFATGVFTPETEGDIDCGFDFYAPQSFLDGKGRRIMIGWMNEWPWMAWFQGFGPTDSENWRGAMSIPRVCRLDGENRLCALPVEEWAGLLCEESVQRDVCLTPELTELPTGEANRYEIVLQGRASQLESRCLRLEIMSGAGKRAVLELSLSHFTLAFSKENVDGYSTGTAYASIRKDIDAFDLRVLVDGSTAEVFFDGGRVCLSTNLYPVAGQAGAALRTPYKTATLDAVRVRVFPNR